MGIALADEENYNELIHCGFTIVDFYSTTCVPCKMFSRILEDIAADIPFINVVKVNITDFPRLGAENQIEAVPTVIFLKNGKELERVVGLMQEEEVLEAISKYYYG